MLIIPGVLASSFPRVSGAFESIATVTGNGSASFLEFTSIPSTFQHLQIRAIVRDTTAGTSVGQVNMVINGNTSAIYTTHQLRGDGSSAVAFASTGETKADLPRANPLSGVTSSTFGAMIVDIHDYASTTKNKTIRAIGGTDANTASTQFQIQLCSNLWINTAAITSLRFNAVTAFATGTTFALYGIKGA